MQSPLEGLKNRFHRGNRSSIFLCCQPENQMQCTIRALTPTGELPQFLNSSLHCSQFIKSENFPAPPQAVTGSLKNQTGFLKKPEILPEVILSPVEEPTGESHTVSTDRQFQPAPGESQDPGFCAPCSNVPRIFLIISSKAITCG